MNDYQCFFTLNILLDKVDRGLWHEKKILLDAAYIVFIKFMTCSYTCKEQILYRKIWLCVKNLTNRYIKRVGFYYKQSSAFIFRHLTLEKSLNTVITKYILDVTIS